MIALLLGFVLAVTIGSGSMVAAMPHVTANMENAQYWINRLEQPHQPILNQREIEEWNKQTRQKLPLKEFKLAEYPKKITKIDLIQQIKEYTIPASARYIAGVAVGADYYRLLEWQCNIDSLPEIQAVRYGLTCFRTDVRSFPTTDFITASPDDCEFDQFQETALDPAEPLIILHQSRDRRWYFAQAYNYRGWVAADKIAIVSNPNEWNDYVNHQKFIIVTGSRLTVADRHFAMGAKLLLADAGGDQRVTENKSGYCVKIPDRDSQGNLVFMKANIDNSADISKGYLPYTRANLLQQAFKVQGEVYGWGGLFGLRDCSALVVDVYRSFGLMLPRNADEQEQAAGNTYLFNGMSGRSEMMHWLLPGATLHMPGHVMIYLGSQNNRYYVIHALGARQGTREIAGPIMRVVVSDLSLTSKSTGKTLLEALSVAKQPQ